VAAWVNVALLWWGLKGFVHLERSNWRKLGGMVLASVMMAIVLLIARPMLSSWLDGGFWQKSISMALLVGVGGTVYALGVILLKVTSVTELKSAFRS